jgi:hypothetical protein
MNLPIDMIISITPTDPLAFLLGIHGLNVLQEIKFGNARLTGDEPDWHGRWTGQVEIVRSTEDDAVNVAVARFEYWRDVADALAELTRKL